MTKKTKKYLIPALVLLALIGGTIYYCAFSGIFRINETAYIYIDKDDTADSVYTKIKNVANPRTMSGFQTMARHSYYNERVRTGRYPIHPNESAFTLLRRLRNGQQEPLNLTVPSVRTMDKLAGTLSRKLMLDSASIAHALYDESTCRGLGYDTTTIACLFIPNTYEVFWDISLDSFLKRMQKENKAFWNADRTAKAKAIGLTPNEVVTLASIIDEETANNGEKPMVAGMYINRLDAKMPLQADPTIKFAMKRFELKRIYDKLLNVKSPYNTYQNMGLPPGPIRIPSVAGIDAVLNHATHDYLYMCAKEDFSGTHNFAHTYREHLANRDKFIKAQNERGIK